MKNFRILFLLAVTFLTVTSLTAQHKIVWDMAQGDTAMQRGLYKQLNNVITAAPETKIEVVFHGNAVYAMLKDTGYLKEQIIALHEKGVLFRVCNNSLKGRNIDLSRVIPEAIVVPVAILELAAKQEEGWSYIKAGN